MIRPIDMHVAFNAIPDFAKLNSGEQASFVYRQIQALSDARNENLIRPERVVRTPERSGLAFNPADIPVLKKNVGVSELRLYAPSDDKKRGVKGFHSRGRDRVGRHFDATA